MKLGFYCFTFLLFMSWMEEYPKWIKDWVFTQSGDHGASELDNGVDWSAEGNISKSGDPEVVFLNQ